MRKPIRSRRMEVHNEKETEEEFGKTCKEIKGESNIDNAVGIYNNKIKARLI